MELGFLAFPLVGALAAFGFAVVTDTRAVHIDHISVPQAVAEATGYNSDVVVARLVDEIHEIERQAKSHAEGRDVEMNEESSPVAVLGEFFEIAPLIRVVQETTLPCMVIGMNSPQDSRGEMPMPCTPHSFASASGSKPRPSRYSRCSRPSGPTPSGTVSLPRGLIGAQRLTRQRRASCARP